MGRLTRCLCFFCFLCVRRDLLLPLLVARTRLFPPPFRLVWNMFQFFCVHRCWPRWAVFNCGVSWAWVTCGPRPRVLVPVLLFEIHSKFMFFLAGLPMDTRKILDGSMLVHMRPAGQSRQDPELQQERAQQRDAETLSYSDEAGELRSIAISASMSACVSSMNSCSGRSVSSVPATRIAQQ